MRGEVRADADERLEVHALPPQARPRAVAPAEGALGDHHGVERFEAVVAHERRGDVVEGGAREHRLDGAVAHRELPAPPRAQHARALLDEQRAALLVVDAARGAGAEQREPGLQGARARPGVALDLVQDRALHVGLEQRPSGGHEDDAVTRRGQRRQRRVHHDGEGQAQRADRGAHARHQRAGVGGVAGDELGGAAHRRRRLGEPLGAEARGPSLRLRVDRIEARAGEPRQLARPGRRAQRRLQRQLANAQEVEAVQPVDVSLGALRERALGRLERAAQLVVRHRCVVPPRPHRPPRPQGRRQPLALAQRVERREGRQHLHVARGLDHEPLDEAAQAARLRTRQGRRGRVAHCCCASAYRKTRIP